VKKSWQPAVSRFHPYCLALFEKYDRMNCGNCIKKSPGMHWRGIRLPGLKEERDDQLFSLSGVDQYLF
jgi:hypothetical protein